MESTLDAAMELLAQDMWPVVVRPRSKKALREGWPEIRYQLDQLAAEFTNGENLGVLLGVKPRPKADVDFDCDEALAVRPFIAGPPTERVFGRRSKPASHMLFEVEDEFDSTAFKDPVLTERDPHAKSMLVELRGRGGQTVIPPSMHESGEPIRWERKGSFGQTTCAQLHRWVAKIAAAALLVRRWQRGHETRFAVAGWLARAGWPEAEAAEFACAVLRVAQPDTGSREVRGDVRACYERVERNEEVFGRPKLAELLGEHGQLVVQTISSWLGLQRDEFPATDGANADRFAEQHAHDVRYCSDQRVWYAWDGRRWQRDALGEAMRRARETAATIYKDAWKTADEGKRKKRVQWAVHSDSRAGLEAMVALARWHPAVEVKSFDQTFDADPLLLNCANGIVDLRTGKLAPHRRETMMTRMSPVAYDPKCPVKKFTEFMARTFASDGDMVSFMQRLGGYFLTGQTGERAFFIVYGETGTAKSTWVRLLHEILGDYAVAIPGRVLLAKRPGEKDYDTCALAGARLATTVETAAGRKLDEEAIKAITGQDILHGERKYEHAFTFRSRAKLLLATNHRPAVRDTDDAIWRRIKPIEFAAKVPDDQVVDQIEKQLVADEGPGILAWFVEGCCEWQKRGLAYPEKVTKAASEYRDEQDEIREFIAECCVTLEKNSPVYESTKTAARDLYAEYAKWAKDSGMRRPNVTKTRLGIELKRLGYESDRTGGTSTWIGIRMLTLGEQPQGTR